VGTRWRDRHAAVKEVAHWEEREEDARRRWKMHVAPEAARLDAEVALHMAVVEQATARLERQAATSQLMVKRGLNLQRATGRLAGAVAAHRDQLDGISRTPVAHPAPGHIRQRQHLAPTPHHEPPDRAHLGSRLEPENTSAEILSL
jgi:hypothetical protein